MGGANPLEIFAHIAAISTAVIAVWAWGWYQVDRYRKRKRLENYLREEKALGRDQGQRTLLNLVATLGMSETEIMDSAFRSSVVARRVSADDQGRAELLFLEYEDEENYKPNKF